MTFSRSQPISLSARISGRGTGDSAGVGGLGGDDLAAISLGVMATHVRVLHLQLFLHPLSLVVVQLQHVGLDPTAACVVKGHIELPFLSGVGSDPVCRQGVQGDHCVLGRLDQNSGTWSQDHPPPRAPEQPLPGCYGIPL